MVNAVYRCVGRWIGNMIGECRVAAVGLSVCVCVCGQPGSTASFSLNTYTFDLSCSGQHPFYSTFHVDIVPMLVYLWLHDRHHLHVLVLLLLDGLLGDLWATPVPHRTQLIQAMSLKQPVLKMDSQSRIMLSRYVESCCYSVEYIWTYIE